MDKLTQTSVTNQRYGWGRWASTLATSEDGKGVVGCLTAPLISRCAYIASTLGLVLSLIALPGWSGSNFIRVTLGKGASIEVPKNWTVFSGSQRLTLDTFVEAKGYRKVESGLNFAANLYDEQGKTMALVNARFYPDNPMTQAQGRQVTPNDLKEIEIEMRKAVEESLKVMGPNMTKWFGTKMQVINGLFVLTHEHQHSGVGNNGATRVRGLRVWNNPRSFTVTLSYRERDATMLLPIIDYMTNSLRQQ